MTKMIFCESIGIGFSRKLSNLYRAYLRIFEEGFPKRGGFDLP
jgi:hypothetical protein